MRKLIITYSLMFGFAIGLGSIGVSDSDLNSGEKHPSTMSDQTYINGAIASAAANLITNTFDLSGSSSQLYSSIDILSPTIDFYPEQSLALSENYLTTADRLASVLKI